MQKASASVDQLGSFSEKAFCLQNPLVCQQFMQDSLPFEDYFVHHIKPAYYEKETLPSAYNYVLLKRRQIPVEVERDRTVFTKTLTVGDELAIPNSVGQLYLYADIDYSIIGKLKNFLFRTTALRVCITDMDGATKEYKVVVPILKTGVLLNLAVIDNVDAYLYFKYNGALNKRIKSVRFLPNANFGKTMEIRIQEIVNRN